MPTKIDESDVVDETKKGNLHRRTKIVATLGHASVPKIRELILAGVNCFRLNFSHTSDPETQTAIVREIRAQSKALENPVAILGDLGGPKIRCNHFQPNPTITLVPQTLVRLVCNTGPGTDGVITTSIAEIIPDLNVGHRVLLDDGTLLLRVEKLVSETEVLCKVIVGGVLKSKKGINVPDLKVNIPALTEKDKRDARYMFDRRLDYVALSFVQKPEDVADLLNLFHKWTDETKTKNITPGENHFEIPLDGDEEELQVQKHEAVWRPLIIAKIETPHAIANIKSIMEITDGIMVARGDLGVECSLQQVPILQKMLMRLANKAEKPCITATQMLESMINSPTPTRAEVSDVANAVFDGTDAVMLSAETATGSYPVETVQMMARICIEAESGPTYMHPPPTVSEKNEHRSTKANKRAEFGQAIADAAVSAANEAQAAAIVVFTTSGETACRVSKRRPRVPIIAITPHPSVARHLSLYYAVTSAVLSDLAVNDRSPAPSPLSPRQKSEPSSTDEIYAFAERHIAERVKSGSGEGILPYIPRLEMNVPIVFCSGYHSLWPGLCNTVKMSRFGDSMRAQHSRGLWAQAVELLHSQHSAVRT